MLLSTQQKFILELLRRLGCVRREQLHALVRGRFQQGDFEIPQARMDAMLRQLRMGAADVRLDDELVWLHGWQPDYRRLEAVNVMIELTGGRPEEISTKAEPPRLLRFTYGGDDLRLFAVASLDVLPPEQMEQVKKERVVWISDSGEAPKGLTLPPKHFFAARQADGSHRFYGSNGP